MKLFTFAVIITLVCCAGNSGSSDIELLTIRGKSVKLDSLCKKSVLIFNKPEATCSDCLKELNSIVRKLNDQYNGKILKILVFPYDEKNIISTKGYSTFFKDLLHQDTTLYDKVIDVNTNTTALFSKFKIESFPSVLLINGNVQEFISSKELFNGSTFENNYKRFEKVFCK